MNKLPMVLSIATAIAVAMATFGDLPWLAVVGIAVVTGFSWALGGAGSTNLTKSNSLNKVGPVIVAFVLSALTALWAIFGSGQSSFVVGMVVISAVTGFAWLNAWLQNRSSAKKIPARVS